MSNLGVFATKLKDLSSSNKHPRDEDNETTCLSDNEDLWQRKRTKKTEKFLNGYDRGQLKAALMESHYMSSVLINRRRDIENYMKKYDDSIPDHVEDLKAKEDQLKLKEAVIRNLEDDVTNLDQELRLAKDVLNALLRQLILFNNKMTKEIDNYNRQTEPNCNFPTDLSVVLNKIISKYADYDVLIEKLK